VLACGELVTLPAPLFETACPAHWQQLLAQLESVDFTLLVPGHTPLTRAAFVTYRTAFDGLLACADSQAASAACTEGWLRDAAPLLVDERDRSLAGALLDYYLTAILRGSAAQRAALCGATGWIPRITA
jgi:hypothetical protein